MIRSCKHGCVCTGIRAVFKIVFTVQQLLQVSATPRRSRTFLLQSRTPNTYGNSDIVRRAGPIRRCRLAEQDDECASHLPLPEEAEMQRKLKVEERAKSAGYRGAHKSSTGAK